MPSFSVLPAIFVIHLNIVIKNGKIVWKHRPYCWYFHLNLKHLEWPYRAYIKTAKNDDVCEELLSENDFEAVLATFCCYDHGTKASEAVQKIAKDQKEYCKCSLCVIICWIAKTYLSLNNSEKWLLTKIPLTYLKKLLKLHQKKSNNWPMVSLSIMKVIQRGWGIALKPKAQNSKQHF